MNRFLLVCALCAFCAVGCSRASDNATQNTNKPATAVASPSPSATSTTQANKPGPPSGAETSQGDVTGAYFAANDLPAEFSEIEHLNLATIDENGSAAPLNGFIRPKRRSAKDYKLVTPKLSGKSLSFTTTTVDGVGYSFTGSFEKLDNFSANPPPSDEVILKGTLKKMKDGEVIAETPVSFTYSAGG